MAFALVAVSMSSCGYNNMVAKKEDVSKAWANVEAQYQRRSDLIPNVVSTVKGSADFEQETLTAVVEARSKATGMNVNIDDLTPEKLQQFENAQNQLSGALSKLMVVVEKYPDLKSTQAYRDLVVELEGTENRISKARNDYNAIVGDYNAYIKQFPRVLYSKSFGFEKKPYFQAKPGTDEAPQVDFSKDE